MRPPPSDGSRIQPESATEREGRRKVDYDYDDEEGPEADDAKLNWAAYAFLVLILLSVCAAGFGFGVLIA